jgi:hypothetical protein
MTTDPILDALDLARAAEAAIQAGTDGAMAQLDDARSALARTVPTSAEGLAALTRFVREAQGNLAGAAPYFDEGEDAEAFRDLIG